MCTLLPVFSPKIFLQEKIRWFTFQACAVVLAHAFVSYYIPILAVDRLLDLVERSVRVSAVIFVVVVVVVGLVDLWGVQLKNE